MDPSALWRNPDTGAMELSFRLNIPGVMDTAAPGWTYTTSPVYVGTDSVARATSPDGTFRVNFVASLVGGQDTVRVTFESLQNGVWSPSQVVVPAGAEMQFRYWFQNVGPNAVPRPQNVTFIADGEPVGGTTPTPTNPIVTPDPIGQCRADAGS